MWEQCMKYMAGHQQKQKTSGFALKHLICTYFIEKEEKMKLFCCIALSSVKDKLILISFMNGTSRAHFLFYVKKPFIRTFENLFLILFKNSLL